MVEFQNMRSSMYVGNFERQRVTARLNKVFPKNCNSSREYDNETMVLGAPWRTAHPIVGHTRVFPWRIVQIKFARRTEQSDEMRTEMFLIKHARTWPVCFENQAWMKTLYPAKPLRT